MSLSGGDKDHLSFDASAFRLHEGDLNALSLSVAPVLLAGDVLATHAPSWLRAACATITAFA